MGRPFLNYGPADRKFHPRTIPTQEEFLDKEFWSVVRDLRAIYRGTLTPRSWSDISCTWSDDTEGMNQTNYSKIKVDYTDPHRGPRRYEEIRRLARKFEKEGIDPYEAKILASQVLRPWGE